uniref:Immunoglobulin V-set domain-containing protein n=1 Tax=Ornithorhynchus anatinus TaxID=9258 RepID=A0A6I8PHP8_ORNAN
MMRVSAALLILCLPDCVAWEVMGPRSVWGHIGGWLTVRCQYKPAWEPYVKCRGEDWESCQMMVKSSGPEATNGRVSIRDNRGNHNIEVTMVNLEAGDTDTYWCGIERARLDLGYPVRVIVFPACTSGSWSS